MPAAKIEFHNRHKSLNGIINLGHGQQRFWVCHEAVTIIVSLGPSTLNAVSQTSLSSPASTLAPE